MTSPPEARGSARPDGLFAALASLGFLLVLFVYGPFNIEQYHHSGPATQIFHSQLWQGRVLFWTHSFGLGTPLPLGENFFFHPLFVLQPLVPLGWLLRAFWWFHAALGAWCTVQLSRRVGADTLLARCSGLAFLVSVPAANYAYTDDWPAVFLGWTMLPMVAYFACRFLVAEDAVAKRHSAALLTLSLTFVLWNSHWGYWIALASPLVVLVLVAAGKRWRDMLLFAAIALVGAALAGDRLLFMTSELARFPPQAELRTQPPFTWSAWIDELVRPLDGRLRQLLWSGHWQQSWQYLLDAKSKVRIPFLGLVFAAAAVWGLARAVAARRSTAEIRLRQGLAAAFVTGLVLSVLPPRFLLDLPSGMWLCRDAAILFGLVTASWLLTELRQAPRLRPFVYAALTFQVVQVVIVALPPVLLVARAQDRNVEFYSAPRADVFQEWLAEVAPERPARVYLSPRLTHLLLSERSELGEFGILGTGDLARFGLLPVNGYFKNVSMDALYPSFKTFGGIIGSEAAVVRDPLTFDALSIRYLLALDTEKGLDFSHLEPSGEPLSAESGRSLRLYRNPDAWTDLQLYPEDVGEIELVQRSDCDETGLLCADFRPLAGRRLDDHESLVVDHDRMAFEVEPSERRRIAVLPFLYRPEWVARSRENGKTGRKLATQEFSRALLAVDLPPGVSEVRLTYRPTLRRRLAFAGWAGWCLLALWTFMSRWRIAPTPRGDVR